MAFLDYEVKTISEFVEGSFDPTPVPARISSLTLKILRKHGGISQKHCDTYHRDSEC